jgi:hypothetical protein
MNEFTPRPYVEIAAERRAAILAGARLIPKSCCHFCAYAVPRGALWCSTLCAQDFEAERKDLLGA